ncbi:MAG: hypothetical protein LUE64_05555, partial [Candidatus Gastranaerophilales bacterium]|nr:hypothetical protein [Candidatus Gastranaerophilales bacterium]
KPYLKVMTDCGTDSDNECMDDTLYKLLNGNNHTVRYGSNANYYKIILADGSLVWWRTNSSSECASSDACAVIWLDINGKNEPNQIGRDTFRLMVLAESCTQAYTDDCYLNSAGFSCIKHVIEYGNLDYPETK